MLAISCTYRHATSIKLFNLDCFNIFLRIARVTLMLNMTFNHVFQPLALSVCLHLSPTSHWQCTEYFTNTAGFKTFKYSFNTQILSKYWNTSN